MFKLSLLLYIFTGLTQSPRMSTTISQCTFMSAQSNSLTTFGRLAKPNLSLASGHNNDNDCWAKRKSEFDWIWAQSMRNDKEGIYIRLYGKAVSGYLAGIAEIWQWQNITNRQLNINTFAALYTEMHIPDINSETIILFPPSIHSIFQLSSHANIRFN